MTFEIHDAFKVGDKVKILHNNKVGIVTSIHENFSECPYTVKYSSYAENCSAKGLILIKEAPQNESFNLYDKVEIVDKKHKFYGAKGIIGYLDGTIDCFESKCRIQTECKTREWYAMESQIKLVSDEQEEEPTFDERQPISEIERLRGVIDVAHQAESEMQEEVERLKRVREIALKANLELQEEIKSLQGTVESYSERLAGYRDEVKQLKQGKEDYKILVTFYNSDDITQYRVLPKESLNRGVNKLIKQGARTFDFYKLRGELKVKTIKTYEIDE